MARKPIVAPLPGGLRLEEGVADGWIRAGQGAGLGPVRRPRPSRSTGAVLREDRGE